jgi:hypothetical protein
MLTRRCERTSRSSSDTFPTGARARARPTMFEPICTTSIEHALCCTHRVALGTHSIPLVLGYVEYLELCRVPWVIPDRTRSRLIVFVQLLTLHSAHAMVKTVTVALLARTNSSWLWAYMATDLCVFIMYKIARGDLIHFMPGMRSKKPPISLTSRFLRPFISPFSLFFFGLSS